MVMVLMVTPSVFAYLTSYPLLFRVLLFPPRPVHLPVMAVLGVFALTLRDVQLHLTFQLQQNISMIH